MIKYPVSVVFLVLATSVCLAEDSKSLSPSELFDARIMPIFASPNPSSCVQCHLSSVDLKEYILPSSDQTFVSLRDQGLIDMKDPAKSKILKLIRMGEKDLDEGARLIHEETRRAEFTAFQAWIEQCCKDPKTCSLPKLEGDEVARPKRPDEIIRHARRSRVVDSFVRNVWSQRMRCFPCHTPHELDDQNPRHKVPIKKQQEFAEQYGTELADRIKFFHETPEATLKHWISRSQDLKPGELPMIDLKDAKQSLVILKPTSKIPKKNEDGKLEVPKAGERAHMGGLKMHVNDQSYKSFIAWIEDYSRVVGDKYTSVENLPSDNWYPTQRVLRLKNAPTSWEIGTPVQLFVHAWDKTRKDWNDEAIAFTQGTVTPRHFVNGALFLLKQEPSVKYNAKLKNDSNHLIPGSYLVRVFVDAKDKLKNDPTRLLGQDDFAGQIEIKKARWRERFIHAEVVSGNNMIAEK